MRRSAFYALFKGVVLRASEIICMLSSSWYILVLWRSRRAVSRFQSVLSETRILCVLSIFRNIASIKARGAIKRSESGGSPTLLPMEFVRRRYVVTINLWGYDLSLVMADHWHIILLHSPVYCKMSQKKIWTIIIFRSFLFLFVEENESAEPPSSKGGCIFIAAAALAAKKVNMVIWPEKSNSSRGVFFQ